jgi:hypothetical protein
MIHSYRGPLGLLLSVYLLTACGGASDAEYVPPNSPTSPGADAGPYDAFEPPGDPSTDGGTEPGDPGGPPGRDPPPPPPGAGGIASLGELPPELAQLAWPEAPHITREVTVGSAAEFASAASVAGTRIHVRGATGGDVSIRVNDIEILADSATSLGRITIERSVSRVRVVGGRWTSGRVAIPASFSSGAEYRPEWMAQDLAFEQVTVTSSDDSAFMIRGKRIAIVRSNITAHVYGVWCGDTAHFASEDIILHDNVIRSAGPEATVRFVSVLRSATIGNRLTNGGKHNYRIHGTSDLNYAADNLLVNTGVMFGTMPGDSLGIVWFDDNIFHHDVPDLFNPEESAIRSLRAHRNLAYTNVWTQFYAGSPPSGWDVADNVIQPYQPAPPEN